MDGSAKNPAYGKLQPINKHFKMKKIILFGISLLSLSMCDKQRDTFIISGRVTDFSGQPIDSATIRLKDRTFKDVYETLTDKNGKYSIEVKKGIYYCLYAIKLSEYRVNRLEYWTWNVPVFKDIVINPQYDRIEIYGINVFEPQVTPQETYMIYFRPMSLFKTLQITSLQKVDIKDFQKAKKTEKLIESTDKLINISPENISPEELTIELNGVKSNIVGINKITEYARGVFMHGYIVQILKPKSSESKHSEYDFISITLHSKETGESGKAEAFVKK